MSSRVTDFNIQNKILSAKLLKQEYRYDKLRKTFSKFYRRPGIKIELKSLLKQGLLEPEVYADLVYKFRKTVGRNDFFLINLGK